MTLTLLVVLAGFATVDQPLTDPREGGSPQTVRPAQEFRVAPLQLGRVPVRPLQLRLVLPAPRDPEPSRPREDQLTSRRTGFTCTMRILRVGPSVDSGIVAKMTPVQPHPDPIVRNDLSPCLQ